ncbi:acetoin reductase family protein [Daedalea quercina L-15889]|uniref:Acetoin reductase family protein n=1 Tax=Daedalea quercina L-15889 TaxID=1314783 RepID=A0A165PME1_9APHY|nr:acetoin reductase family protein [Daedalea quercina L-15889]
MAPGQTTPFTVAFITGAAQGIGREIALRLADEGFNVAINDIPSNADALHSVAKEVEAKGRKALPLFGDVSEEDTVRVMVEKAVEVLGRLDVMIANAAIAIISEIVDLDVEKFDRALAVNVRGVMLCYKYAARQMIKQGNGGRILGAASILGKRGGPMAAAYVASKFAVRGLTQCLAIELAPHHITVNTYAPGVILTPMTAMGALDEAKGGGHGAATKWVCGLPPDGPAAGPEVVASLVSYLVKPEAYFITGQSLTVDGGVVFN